MAGDAIMEAGLTIAPLLPESIAGVQKRFPDWATAAHPLDIEPLMEMVGGEQGYRIGLETILDDPTVDMAMLVMGVDIFQEGEPVDVTGITKGRGFAGTVKRHKTQRGPESHGSKYHRRVGSLSASSDPSRVYKGKPMPGHMGNQRRTMLNLKVVGMQKDKNILMIKGSVPGFDNGYVMVRKAKKQALKDARR